MGQVEFLRALLETGRVRVDPPDRGILPADPPAPGVSAADEQETLAATLALGGPVDARPGVNDRAIHASDVLATLD